MSHGATIITPNNRLSNQLLADFYAQKESTFACDKPLCIPYQTFLNDLYTQIRHQQPKLNHPILLTNQQQRYLWRQILTQQDNYPCNDGLLHEIQDAWKRCQQWQINMNDPAFANTPQTRQFQAWQQQFQDYLIQHQLLTNEQLVSYILNFKVQFNSTRIIWACFDDYTPEQRALQHALQTQGFEQHYYDIGQTLTTTYQFQANDRQDEYLQMIHWVKNRLSAGDKRIGVVVPDLQVQGTSIQRLIQQSIPDSQFNISLGKNLCDFSLVTHALNWLQLDKQVLSHHQVRLLLHSPYLAGSRTEFISRAESMQDSFVLQEAVIPYAVVVQAFSKTNPILSQILTQLTNYPDQASPQNWVQYFKTRLITLGFPGEYSLDSATYQCFQRFLNLFEEFLQLSTLTSSMTRQDALDTLHDYAKNTIFQTRQPKTPIQILGLLEASGCNFDSIWICGLTDQCLPQKTNLSAFIPLELQRDHQMPHACSARELQLAQQVLHRLQHGSLRSVHSFPHFIGDMPNLPSPLITQLSKLERFELPITQSPIELVKSEEHYLLPLTPAESAAGGTSLLANQAKCPFRAFAAHRLHAKTAKDLSTGPDALERGQIIHRVMELLWQTIGSQQQLLTMAFDDLNHLIETTIIQSLEPVIQSRSLSFPRIIQDIELIRLKRLVKACFEWEKQRPPFVIDALEQTFTINLAGLDLRVRIDRLDKILLNSADFADAQNEKWVIDYKSSIPINKPWNEDRPEAPQLLLYALLDANIKALIFIQLKAGQINCNGLSEQQSDIKGLSSLKKNERWSDYQEQWQQQLHDLANEFYLGRCPPLPTRKSTCEQCEFQNLCRIDR